MIPVSRRGLLATIAAGVAGSAAARTADASEYVVEQGDRCIPITPLSGDETAEAFYDYRTPDTTPSGPAYSSYGTTDLQRPETSVCFLYDGPEGLSLVLLHDRLDDGTNGGAVTFRLGLENPDRGAWVVGDDDYDAATNYDTFAPTDEGWRVDWTWAEGRSDGGVYRPLGDDFELTIDPAFNEDAALSGDHYEGRITDWQVLSGDRDSPDRFSLALDRPLTIRPGSCGGATTTPTETETTTEEGEQDDGQSSGLISPEVELVPGKLNPESHGRLPVVVRSTEGFDATDLARGSIAFGPAGRSESASPVKRIRTDADGDGRRDLKLHFWMDATGIERATEAVRLTGETESGRQVEAVAEVELVPNGDDEERDEDENDETESKEDESETEDDDAETGADGSEEREEDDAEREENNEEKESEGDGDGGDEEDDDDDREDEHDRKDDDDWKEGDDDSGHPGRGNGKGRGRGRGNGKGRGNGRGKGGDEDD